MTRCTDNLEIEVKFHVTDTDAIRRRLIEMGAVAGERRFERNLRFDNRRQDLYRKDQLLRLRQDGACRLTWKQKPASCDDQECKVYHELEVEVGDHDTMAAILNALGYRSVQCYEKWRRTFAWRDVEICLDQMPFGTFLEIEGDAGNIKSAARRLGLIWGERILTNYLAIFELLREAHALPFNDLTFDNFRRHPVSIEPHLPALQTCKSIL